MHKTKSMNSEMVTPNKLTTNLFCDILASLHDRKIANLAHHKRYSFNAPFNTLDFVYWHPLNY